MLYATLLHTTVAWWDDRCAEGGQCMSMINNYQTLIQGEGCRSFYVTGKCSRICTFSLKSLIRRHSWSKCAERCEWQKSVTAAAQSWLSMCLARPEPDVLGQDASGPATDRIISDQNANASSLLTEETTLRNSVFTVFRVFVLCCGAVMLGLLLRCQPTFRAWLSRTFRVFAYRLGQWWKPSAKTSSGKGPLDGLPSRHELRVLQRGARRHLKALRSNLD